jgi:hypothetical protein
MSSRRELINFIGDCIVINKCWPVSERKQNEWIGQLSEIPAAAFPEILDKLSQLKLRPKNFTATVLRIYRELPVVELTKTVELTKEVQESKGWFGNFRDAIARLMVQWGV